MNTIIMEKGENFGSPLKHTNYPLVTTGTGALPLPMLPQPERETTANTTIAETSIFFIGYLTLSVMMDTQNSFGTNTFKHPC